MTSETIGLKRLDIYLDALSSSIIIDAMWAYDNDCIRSNFLNAKCRCQYECPVDKHPSASMLAKSSTNADNLGEASPPQ